MRKKTARRKTTKAVSKRFKVTKGGKGKKLLHSKAGRRHLAASKNRKRKRNLAKRKTAAKGDLYRLTESLPFG